MKTLPSDLTAALRPGLEPSRAMVPRPRSRWKTRVLIPAVVLGGAAGLFWYSARAAFTPAVRVHVAPVVARAADARSGHPATPTAAAQAVIAQAPGWIEPDPYAVNVPALAEGVIREVLVLEGQRVEEGQVVARMVDQDARLEVRRWEAELDQRRAEVQKARAVLDAAHARAAEVRDEVQRKRDLVTAGGVSEGQFARLELRLLAMEREASSAKADVIAAESAEKTHQVACEQAALALERMTIRAPVSGVVMARLVEPGTRVSMGSKLPDGTMAGAVVRLYDPQKLQVRVDVPLAETGRVSVGAGALITTEALPDRVFHGTVTRIVHEANIQRNTVQFKVALAGPDPALKPEMLVRVRFVGEGRAAPAGPANAGENADAGLQLLVPRASIHHDPSGRATLWIVDLAASRDGPTAAVREIVIDDLDGAPGSALTRVRSGVNPGDRVILDAPTGLRPGDRLEVVERSGGSERAS